MEILIVLAILTILVLISISSFGKIGGSEALNASLVSTISVLNEAKSMAISSKDASDYGVRIFSNKLITFKNSYGNENNEVDISNLVTISTSSGVGTDIIFNNVSGNTTAGGTISITVLSDPSKSGTIKIYPTGVIEKN